MQSRINRLNLIRKRPAIFSLLSFPQLEDLSIYKFRIDSPCTRDAVPLSLPLSLCRRDNNDSSARLPFEGGVSWKRARVGVITSRASSSRKTKTCPPTRERVPSGSRPATVAGLTR